MKKAFAAIFLCGALSGFGLRGLFDTFTAKSELVDDVPYSVEFDTWSRDAITKLAWSVHSLALANEESAKTDDQKRHWTFHRERARDIGMWVGR